jgi:response regulator RpfG family c-di-GMP phosphodiesterase
MEWGIMSCKILFVDDEPSILEGYKRMLHRDFQVDTAASGIEGLTLIRDHGPYSIVISDMRMPGMNGAEFLAQVRQTSPDTVRMLLTGFTDIDAAIEAVNQGNIFRLLAKPCGKESMLDAINAGVYQYRLVMVEKELLEDTLMGSIKVMTEVLSAASPEAFGRSMRITRTVRHIMANFNLPSPWRFETAAMLSQLGCVTLDPEVMRAAFFGERLSPEDQARFEAHPQVAKDLLAPIPRMEPIAWMIGQQLTREPWEDGSGFPDSHPDEIVLGARILRLAVVFDNLKMRGLTDEEVLAQLRIRQDEFGVELVAALLEIDCKNATMQMRKISTARLTIGMILQQEIRTKAGALIAPKGQEITPALRIKLENFSRAGSIGHEVLALIPATL